MKKNCVGVLIIAKETNNFLLLLRSKKSDNGGVWAVLSGGVEENESIMDALKREIKEEIGYSKNIKFVPYEVEETEFCNFYLFIGHVNKEFDAILDSENDDYGWFNMKNIPKPLYPKLEEKLKKINEI